MLRRETEVDVTSAWRLRRQSFSVAVAGVVNPLVAGTDVAWVACQS